MKIMGLGVVVGLVGLVGCDFSKPTGASVGQCEITNQTIQIQSNAQRAQADANTIAQQRLLTLQLEVVKGCIGKGGVPVLVNQNVDCKKGGA